MRKIVPLLALIIVLAGCQTNWITLVSSLNPVNTGVASAEDAQGEEVQGDALRGEDIFVHGVNDAPPCSGCHARVPGGYSLAPIMQGIGERAATRVEGMTASDYLHQSILDPGAHLVPGFRNIMYPQYAEKLSEQDVADLVAYLLTL